MLPSLWMRTLRNLCVIDEVNSCKIGAFDSRVYEDSSLVGCYAMPISNSYRRIDIAQSLHVQGHATFLGLLITSRHVNAPEDLTLQNILIFIS
jgi:hypothetical protein